MPRRTRATARTTSAADTHNMRDIDLKVRHEGGRSLPPRPTSWVASGGLAERDKHFALSYGCMFAPGRGG